MRRMLSWFPLALILAQSLPSGTIVDDVKCAG